MIKPKNLIVSIIIISVSVGSLFFLLASSSVPVLTVKELMDQPQPESYLNRKVQIVGIVNEYEGSNFSINDPDYRNNGSLIIFIEATNVEKPTGFEIGKTVLIEGKLVSISNI
ncbi:MAG: hypothetical protein ACW964_12590, partial [Candidatus Hodarchaeales archaeon]